MKILILAFPKAAKEVPVTMIINLHCVASFAVYEKDKILLTSIRGKNTVFSPTELSVETCMQDLIKLMSADTSRFRTIRVDYPLSHPIDPFVKEPVDFAQEPRPRWKKEPLPNGGIKATLVQSTANVVSIKKPEVDMEAEQAKTRGTEPKEKASSYLESEERVFDLDTLAMLSNVIDNTKHDDERTWVNAHAEEMVYGLADKGLIEAQAYYVGSMLQGDLKCTSAKAAEWIRNVNNQMEELIEFV